MQTQYIQEHSKNKASIYTSKEKIFAYIYVKRLLQ